MIKFSKKYILIEFIILYTNKPILSCVLLFLFNKKNNYSKHAEKLRKYFILPHGVVKKTKSNKKKLKTLFYIYVDFN
jgi:hypothetical protein